jgi:hypothetical protein
MCRFRGLTSQRGINLAAGHDRGLRQGVPHDINYGGELCPPSLRRWDTRVLPAPVATTPWLKDILDIAVAQQAESSL